MPSPQPPSSAGQRTVSLVTLGCARNEVDSEELAGRLEASGWTLTDRDEAAVVLVNTCGFIEAAKQESIGELLDGGGSGARWWRPAAWPSVTGRSLPRRCRKPRF